MASTSCRAHENEMSSGMGPACRRVTCSAASGTTLSHAATALHADGSERVGADIRWSSSDPAVATVDPFGNVLGVTPGDVAVVAPALQGSHELAVGVDAAVAKRRFDRLAGRFEARGAQGPNGSSGKSGAPAS